MLTDIRVLADHFLMALPNINKHFWRCCRGEIRFAVIALSLAIILYDTVTKYQQYVLESWSGVVEVLLACWGLSPILVFCLFA